MLVVSNVCNLILLTTFLLVFRKHRNIPRDLQLEYGKGTLNYVNEYTYLGVKITKDGNHEPEINDRINRGRAAITKLNSILWDREVTPPKQRLIFIMQ